MDLAEQQKNIEQLFEIKLFIEQKNISSETIC